MMRSMAFSLAASLALGLASACLANDLKATEQFGATVVSFKLGGSYTNVTLTIAGPDNFFASAFTPGDAPSIDLRSFGPLEDGSYVYQLTAATEEKLKVRTRPDSGREAGAPEPRKGAAVSGTFDVKGGAIVKRDPTERQDTPVRQ